MGFDRGILMILKSFVLSFSLLFFAVNAQAAKLDVVGEDPLKIIGVGFARAHWATSINKMLVFLVPGKHTSIRAFDPVSKAWEFLWPENKLGIQGRDNYYSFYIPRLDEIWVWDGSYLWDNPDARYSGRFSVKQQTMGGYGTNQYGCLCRDPRHDRGRRQNAAKRNRSSNGVGHLSRYGASLYTRPNVHFRAQNRRTRVIQSNFARWSRATPPWRSQCMNCLVSDGKNFYLFGGFYREPNNPAWLNRKDLWKFDTAAKTWSQLPQPPDVAYAPVLTYDSDRKALVTWVRNKIYVFDLLSQRWTEQTPRGGIPSISNQVGVYAPTAKLHLFLGGNANDNMPANDFSGPSPGPQVYALALEGPVAAERREPGTAATNSTGLDIPLRTWIARAYNKPNAPAAGVNGRGGVGSKHLRFAQNPLNGRIYVLGGDYQSDYISDIQLWTYDVPSDRWMREKEPPCGTEGEILPGGPDEVGWVWDSKRKQFWVLPGFYFLSEGVLGTCGGGGSTGQSWDVSKPLVLEGYAVYLVVDYKTGKRLNRVRTTQLQRMDPNKSY